MSTKRVADIVFCLDASDSMRPCFEAMCRHIDGFIGGLSSNRQMQWDWRIDFVAHSCGDSTIRCESLHYDSEELIDSLYHHPGAGQFFTSDLDEFRRRLSRIQAFGDEAPLVALDCCLDFPWRRASRCHRVVVLMTDEPFETSAAQQDQLRLLPTLVDKIQKMHIMLYLVAPESAGFDRLAAIDKSVYEVADQSRDGLASVNFHQMLLDIGKSVSVCDLQMPSIEEVPRGVFGQAGWAAGGSMSSKDRT